MSRVGRPNKKKIIQPARPLTEDERATEQRLLHAIFPQGALNSAVLASSAARSKNETQREPEQAEHEDGEKGDAPKRRPAWQDEGDADVPLMDVARTKKLRKNAQEKAVKESVYEERLREQFRTLSRNVEWARLPEEQVDPEADAVDAALLRSTAPLKGTHTGPLQPDEIDIVRLKDANTEARSAAVVRAVQFHRAGELLLTAGLDKTVRLFHVDGKKNEKVHSVFFEDLPIYSAFFGDEGRQVTCTGRRPFFYFYDISTGQATKVPGIKGAQEKSLETCLLSPDGSLLTFLCNNGYVHLVSNATKQWVGSVKMNGSVRAAAYSPNGKELYTTGGDGEVYLWDVGKRTCINRFVDSGSLSSTTLAVSPDGRYQAAGSESGVVNLYDAAAVRTARTPQPLKNFMQVTTAVTALKFNHDSQLLGITTREQRDVFKLVHLPSMHVYSNWPTTRTPLRYVSCFDFSPRSGYLALGNDAGRVLLYRLTHFDQVW